MSEAVPPNGDPPASAVCDVLRVTAYVDGALGANDRVLLEAHLVVCTSCRTQLDAERALSLAIRSLPEIPLPHGLASRVRRRSRKPVTLRRRVWVPSLAALLVLFLWGRGSSPFVAWELATDHAHCFGRQQVPADVLTDDPLRLSVWFEATGTELPHVPASAGGLDLVGGRYCRVLDRTVAHVYYGGGQHQLSLFVIPGTVHGERPFVWHGKGTTVNLLHVAGANVALVSSDEPTIEAFRRSLERTVAERGPLVTTPPPVW